MTKNKKKYKKILCYSNNCLNNCIDLYKNHGEKTKNFDSSTFIKTLLEANHRLLDMRIIKAIEENKKKYDVVISVSGAWHDENIQKEIPNLGFVKQEWPQNKIKETVQSKKFKHKYTTASAICLAYYMTTCDQSSLAGLHTIKKLNESIKLPPPQPVKIGRFDKIVERLLNQNSLSDTSSCAIQ